MKNPFARLLAAGMLMCAIGLAVIGTNADKDLYTAVDGAGRTKKLGETTAVVSISKTF